MAQDAAQHQVAFGAGVVPIAQALHHLCDATTSSGGSSTTTFVVAAAPRCLRQVAKVTECLTRLGLFRASENEVYAAQGNGKRLQRGGSLGGIPSGRWHILHFRWPSCLRT
jgi:phosphotransferase system IIB component